MWVCLSIHFQAFQKIWKIDGQITERSTWSGRNTEKSVGGQGSLLRDCSEWIADNCPFADRLMIPILLSQITQASLVRSREYPRNKVRDTDSDMREVKIAGRVTYTIYTRTKYPGVGVGTCAGGSKTYPSMCCFQKKLPSFVAFNFSEALMSTREQEGCKFVYRFVANFCFLFSQQPPKNWYFGRRPFLVPYAPPFEISGHPDVWVMLMSWVWNGFSCCEMHRVVRAFLNLSTQSAALMQVSVFVTLQNIV